MINDKQDDRQEDRTVKFTDYAIDKYQFNFDNYKGKSVGVKLENSGLMGRLTCGVLENLSKVSLVLRNAKLK